MVDEAVTLDQVKAEVEAAEHDVNADNQESGSDEAAQDQSSEKKESVKSFKTRKDLAEAVNECKANNQGYTIRRSTVEGFRYDLITEALDDLDDVENVTSLVPVEAEGEVEVVDGIEQEMPVEYTPQQEAFMSYLQRVAGDIAEAIRINYEIDADPQLIIADILRDLKLISGDVSVDELGDSASDRATRDLFNSYNEFCNFADQLISEITGTEFVSTPRMKLIQAIKILGSSAFSTENIHRRIASPEFVLAARGGQVPYIGANELPQLEAALPESLRESNPENPEVCEGCGKSPCECMDEELSDELVELLDTSNVEVDTDRFDDDVNEYLNESFDTTMIYTTVDGYVEEGGKIVLEGLLQAEDSIKPVTFTLEPENMITESYDQLSSETFKVTNSVSEEVFEFKFNK